MADDLQLDQVTAEDFEPHTGARFDVQLDAGEVVLVLDAVRRLGPSTAASRGEAFALDLRGPAEPVLGSRIWRLSAPAVGTMEIFLSPVARGPDGTMQYEAIFN